MTTKFADILMQNKVFAWIALVTVLILMVPLAAMQFTEAVDWSLFDFAIMGVLLLGTGTFFVVAARKVDRKYWLSLGPIVGAAFLYVWAELAVGIFTNWGS